MPLDVVHWGFFLLVLIFSIETEGSRRKEMTKLNCVYSIAIVFIFYFSNEVWPNLLIKQGKDKTAEERRIAICIFDDVVEHCREAALK